MINRRLDTLLTIALALLAALSAYYSTVENLKLELAGKAEDAFVAGLDKRLSNLETRLAENFAGREDIFRLKQEIVERLYRIENRLDRIENVEKKTVVGGVPVAPERGKAIHESK